VGLLQRKYAEEKARAAALARTKLTLESKQRALQTEIERLEKESASVLTENKAISEELKRKAQACQASLEKLSQQCAKLKVEHDTLEGKYAQKVKDCDGKVSQLSAEKTTLESEIKRQGQRLERCQTHNARLCVIADELVEKYKNKGITSSILQKEPFTQLEKVEIEEIVQEYKEKIEEQKLEVRGMNHSLSEGR